MGVLAWLNQTKRISDLEETCVRLERLITARDMDWGDLRARCKRLLDRDEKAVRYLNNANASNNEVESSAAPTNGEPVGGSIGGYAGRLSEHQKQIQQQILRRRGGG